MATRALSNGYEVPTYEGDYAAWCFHQAMLLRSKQLHLLDYAYLAEELDSLGNSQFTELQSRIAVIMMHMLKWDYQPERRTRSWTLSIRIQRSELANHLEENPSLRRRVDEAVRKAYGRAFLDAMKETGLDDSVLPPDCPYDRDAVMNRPFDWPAA